MSQRISDVVLLLKAHATKFNKPWQIEEKKETDSIMVTQKSRRGISILFGEDIRLLANIMSCSCDVRIEFGNPNTFIFITRS